MAGQIRDINSVREITKHRRKPEQYRLVKKHRIKAKKGVKLVTKGQKWRSTHNDIPGVKGTLLPGSPLKWLSWTMLTVLSPREQRNRDKDRHHEENSETKFKNNKQIKI
ncbi:hypothetical protein EVAR_85867_1 [Eumeta japonica]|uniref:Uncharacterized protein n=1 Tax=Eumeta variegata TaxID=151549 RepID=A0A4C2A7I3_EUMVA|nr:hypothetical protein EVAR_85867_1 [Eumeta japonica]